MLKVVWSSFGLDSTLLTDGSILRVLGVTSLIITEGPPITEAREGGAYLAHLSLLYEDL